MTEAREHGNLHAFLCYNTVVVYDVPSHSLFNLRVLVDGTQYRGPFAQTLGAFYASVLFGLLKQSGETRRIISIRLE